VVTNSFFPHSDASQSAAKLEYPSGKTQTNTVWASLVADFCHVSLKTLFAWAIISGLTSHRAKLALALLFSSI